MTLKTSNASTPGSKMPKTPGFAKSVDSTEYSSPSYFSLSPRARRIKDKIQNMFTWSKPEANQLNSAEATYEKSVNKRANLITMDSMA